MTDDGRQPHADTTSGFEMLKLRPAHVVVFKERSERNARRISDTLGARWSAQKNLRPSIDLLMPHKDDLPHTRVYHRLGVAVGSFHPEQLDKLRKHEHVAVVEPNHVRRLPPVRYAQSITDSVPAEGSSPEALTWCLTAIGLAADGSEPTGAGVKVAVLDTGLDLTHPDFDGRVETVNTRGFVPGVQGVQDDNGHGTHCSGIAAGPLLPHGGGARFGVAPGATLIIGKVLDKHESGTDDHILDGIDWAVDQGARVISMSLGSPRDENAAYSKAYETIAASVAQDGTLIVGAAGNDSERNSFRRPVNNPAACPSILAVAALDRFNGITPFSAATLDTIGQVDIGAPGDGVVSTWLGGKYRASSGTSMAAPHVVGVAALLLELHPTLTVIELADMLRSIAVGVGLDASDTGAGLAQCPAP